MMRGALEAVDGEGLPGEEYEDAADRLGAVEDWLHSEEARIRAKVLEGGGLRPPG